MVQAHHVALSCPAVPLRQMAWPTGVAHPAVSIWILDKRSMAEAGASPAEIEAAAETARRDAGGLTRLKHPAIVKVRRMPC
jgi:hypothetical protein